MTCDMCAACKQRAERAVEGGYGVVYACCGSVQECDVGNGYFSQERVWWTWVEWGGGWSGACTQPGEREWLGGRVYRVVEMKSLHWICVCLITPKACANAHERSSGERAGREGAYAEVAIDSIWRTEKALERRGPSAMGVRANGGCEEWWRVD